MRARGGFSVVEMLVAMALTLAVFAITLPFVRVQTRALGSSAGRLDAEQVARYAQRTIDRDLRLATADPGQPLLVYAGPRGISFNANLLASDTADLGAVEVEAGAPTSLTLSWRAANAAAIPLTARTYPPTDFLDARGEVSRNETISYFLHPDTVTGRSDVYVLYRRVNARDSVQVVRGLQVPADSGFFTYLRPVGGVMTPVAAARLPLFWDSLAIDSIRVVGIRATGLFRDRFTGEATLRTVRWSTVLANAPGRLVAGCAAAPAAPPANSVRPVTPPKPMAVPFRVELSWNDSPDDNGGSRDVTHYLIDRKPVLDTAWVTVATVPALRVDSYEWHDAFPLTLGSIHYGVRAVGCGGLVSPRAVGSSVTLP
jgi:hypothetical protein